MSDDKLYLYTSLTAGSSHIITATSRIETILKANKIPFTAVDCATDPKARLLWGRRSKGKKIPGLVKYGDVIGDLEQIEEWNEYGELKDEIDSVIDIFGDVPVSATSAEAQAAAAARASNAERPPSTGPSRSSSETRHISISDPKDKVNPAATSKKDDTPLSMAMRQAGAEAAAKAGQKKTASTAVAKAEATADATDKATPAPVQETKLAAAAAEPDEKNTAAKTPVQLENEGLKKPSLDSETPTETDSSEKSTEEQVLDQKRKSSVPNNPSTLAKETSVDDAHTMVDSDAKVSGATPATRAHRGSEVVETDAAKIREIEEANKITEEVEDDDEDEEDDEEEHEEDKGSAKTGSAQKIAASDKQEEHVLTDSKP